MPMTKEEFKELINSDEVKDLFKETTTELGLVPEAELKMQFEKETEGLKKKRDELLAETVAKKEAAAKYKEMQSVLESHGVQSEELETLLYKMQHPEANEEVLELQRRTTKAERDLELKLAEMETYGKTIEAKDADIANKKKFIDKLLIDSAFSSAMSEFGFQNIEYIMPKLIMDSKSVVEPTEDGSYKAITDDGSSIKEWIQRFAETEQGKALRGVPNSVGGGATGAGGNPMNKAWKDMNFSERNTLHNTNPDLYERLKQKG